MSSDVPSGDHIFADDAEDMGTKQPPVSPGETERKGSGGQDARRQRKVVYPDPIPDPEDKEPAAKRSGGQDARRKRD
jgi:hypothetical protein